MSVLGHGTGGLHCVSVNWLKPVKRQWMDQCVKE